MKTVRVTQYYKGKPVASYASMSVAADLSGARVSHISEVVSGDRKSAGGFTWKRGIKLRSASISAVKGKTIVAGFNGLDAIRDATRVRTGQVLKALNNGFGARPVGGYNWV